MALVADDFPGLKPGMLVEVGDSVARGQPLVEDRKIPGVRHTAPGAGKIIAINRGARRALQSVVIELSEAQRRPRRRRMRGLGITFIVVGLMSMGFMAFSGIQL